MFWNKCPPQLTYPVPLIGSDYWTSSLQRVSPQLPQCSAAVKEKLLSLQQWRWYSELGQQSQNKKGLECIHSKLRFEASVTNIQDMFNSLALTEQNKNFSSLIDRALDTVRWLTVCDSSVRRWYKSKLKFFFHEHRLKLSLYFVISEAGVGGGKRFFA